MSRSHMHYNLKPRYTGGSPAAVWDEALALRVVEQERTAHEHALSGAYGEAEQKKATMLGLRGIVETVIERKGGWEVEDLLTREKFWRGEVRAHDVLRDDRILDFDRSLLSHVRERIRDRLPLRVMSVRVIVTTVNYETVPVFQDPAKPVNPFDGHVAVTKRSRVKIERARTTEV